MDTQTLLWIDLRFRRSTSDLFSQLREHYPTHRVEESSTISATIQRIAPHLLCFDYDYPDAVGLKALQQTKIQHPSLPILMLTEYHSEPLAVWAFRTRVWDYLVKPVKAEEVLRLIVELAKLMNRQKNQAARNHPFPLHPIPMEVRYGHKNGDERALLPAISYVEAHYPEKIALEEIARLCGMGLFHFSRAFKRIRGMTFQEFLLQHRIGKALKLLRNPRSNVTEVAFAVGFNDLSHFARMFRRYVGLCPSKYRLGNGVTPSQLFINTSPPLTAPPGAGQGGDEGEGDNPPIIPPLPR